MKNRKIRIALFLSLVCFCSILQQNDMRNNDNENKNKNNNLITLPSISASNEYEWNKTWGGSDGEIGDEIRLDGSGNILITGETQSYGAGNYDVFLLKYDSDGNLLWNITWGGSESEYGNGIEIDSLENILTIGSTMSYGAGYNDVFLLKYNSSGNLLWNKTWGGSGLDEGNGIVIDGSGNILITGATQSYGAGATDTLLLKYDSDGNLLWYKTWGGFGYECGFGIAVDGSGNILITGSTSSYGAGEDNTFILKYDSDGNLLWYKIWGGNDNDCGDGITLDSSGNAFITGGSRSYGAENYNVFLLKYDSNGNKLWNTTWGGSKYDYGYGIILNGSGNVLITGSTSSYGAGANDVLILKYDSDGNQLWYKTWGGNDTDCGYGITLDDSGNIFISGYTESIGVGFKDVFLLKIGIDMDDDGLNDGDEINTYGTDPNDPDSDDDGLNDGSEINTYGTDPNDPDTDNDNMPDGWEVLSNLDPLIDDSSEDPDTDSLSNLEEYQNNTDPNDPDSDDDGLNDESEINTYGTNPNDPDSDDEGLNDESEINVYGTNPNDPDSDDDGLNDEREINVYGTNPNDPDSDNDGYTDGEEINSGTDPLNFRDNWFFRALIITIILSSITILIISYIIVRKRKVKKINTIVERSDNLKAHSNLEESIESYQEALFKTKSVIKVVPKSLRSIIKEKLDETLELQIKQLLEKVDKLKYNEEDIKAIEILNLAQNFAKKIVDKSIEEKINQKIINILDQVYVEIIEAKIEEALTLREIKNFDESINKFNDIFSEVEKLSDEILKEKYQLMLKDYIDTTRMIKTKNKIFNLSQNYTRLEVSNIIEKAGEGEGLILSALQDMIMNREISAEYFKSSKEVAFHKQINIEEIDKLMKSFEDWEKEGKSKKL
ncbi:MAG: hypothetical protein ACFFDH_05725 [Promethearchaeota archaeon]